MLQTVVQEVMDNFNQQRKIERQENPLQTAKNDIFNELSRP